MISNSSSFKSCHNLTMKLNSFPLLSSRWVLLHKCFSGRTLPQPEWLRIQLPPLAPAQHSSKGNSQSTQKRWWLPPGFGKLPTSKTKKTHTWPTGFSLLTLRWSRKKPSTSSSSSALKRSAVRLDVSFVINTLTVSHIDGPTVWSPKWPWALSFQPINRQNNFNSSWVRSS